MIPRDYITEWRARAPWERDSQVGQDLVICRALIDICSHPLLKGALAFRGGTALYKLHLKPAARYSEGHRSRTGQGRRRRPNHSGAARRSRSLAGRAALETERRPRHLVYRFNSEDTPPIRLRLKVEINSREHLPFTASPAFPSQFRLAGMKAPVRSPATRLTSFLARNCVPCLGAGRSGPV